MARAVYYRDGIGRKDLSQIHRRFTLIHRERLRRIARELLPAQQEFIDLLPLLFHINHPMLPGFVNTATPAGIPDFSPSEPLLQTAKKISRSFEYRKRARRALHIQGLYLMGSIGSVAHTAGSDFDIWLCRDPALEPGAVESLKVKANRIETWARSLGLEVHFFVMNVDGFRRGERESLSHESSGTTQRRLLLEEFYRTGVLLAGRYPLWWLVPPEKEGSYSEYARMLLHKRFVDPLECIDFGGLETLAPDEFFGAAYWQLFKGIESPYKTILKLFLTEAYSQSYPAVRWLCQEAKAEIYAGQSNADELDPYVLMMRRLEQYLSSRGEETRLELARRCFYFKTGQRLTAMQVRRKPSWQQELVEKLIREWDWDGGHLTLLDSRESWKIDRVLDERNTLVRELTHSFRLLTDFARTYADAGAIDPAELSLLGRKLYAALESKPGKVDSINPGISLNLEEEQVSLHHSPTAAGGYGWFLYRGDIASDQAARNEPIKTTPGLMELLTWCHLNGIIGHATRISLYPDHCPVTRNELQSLRQALAGIYPGGVSFSAPIAQLSSQPYALACALFINIGDDPLASLAKLGKQLTSNRCDPLSFGAAHASLVAGVEQLTTTSWGETLVVSHGGETGVLDSLCHHLRLLINSPAGARPEVSAHSFSSVRAQGIARRVEGLFNEASRAFSPACHGPACRYLLQLSDDLYLIQYRREKFQYSKVSSADELYDLLAEPQSEFSTLVIDRLTLTESPLHAIYEQNQPDSIQLFYLIEKDHTQLYLLDERGSLFRQRLQTTEPHYLLRQQQRFLNGIGLMRNLQEEGPSSRSLLDAPRFYQLIPDRDQKIAVQPRTPPGNRLADNYLELHLTSGGLDLNRSPQVLTCGERKFSSLEFGDRLFHAVAEHILSQRRNREAYPVYLTGLELSGISSGNRVSTIDFFNFKRRVEQRLCEALEILSQRVKGAEPGL